MVFMVDTPSLPGLDPAAPAQVAPANLKQFLLAGNATFTVRSGKTQTRFTLKVRKPTAQSPHFVSVLNGSDNEHSYQFVGTIFANGTYSHGVRSKITPDAPSAKAARWVVERVLAGQELPNCELWHEGRCGRCGRKLTVPESIELGLGPECATRV
jgi:hypothetical protein